MGGVHMRLGVALRIPRTMQDRGWGRYRRTSVDPIKSTGSNPSRLCILKPKQPKQICGEDNAKLLRVRVCVCLCACEFVGYPSLSVRACA